MPSAGYLSLVLHMTVARVASRLTAGQRDAARTGRASPDLGMMTAALTRELIHKRPAYFYPQGLTQNPISWKLTGNYRVITM
jgi:hypothetical protein